MKDLNLPEQEIGAGETRRDTPVVTISSHPKDPIHLNVT